MTPPPPIPVGLHMAVFHFNLANISGSAGVWSVSGDGGPSLKLSPGPVSATHLCGSVTHDEDDASQECIEGSV